MITTIDDYASMGEGYNDNSIIQGLSQGLNSIKNIIES